MPDFQPAVQPQFGAEAPPDAHAVSVAGLTLDSVLGAGAPMPAPFTPATALPVISTPATVDALSTEVGLQTATRDDHRMLIDDEGVGVGIVVGATEWHNGGCVCHGASTYL